MKLKNIRISLAVISVLSFGLIGCGSSSDNTAVATQTGTFVDAPVQGLSYKTATQSGFTDAQGEFKYKDGETVEFKLGTLSLGKGKAETFVTPYSISDNNTTATNIALVLQNFDSNRSNTQVLNLSNLKDYNFTTDDINITATSTTLQSKLTTLLSTASFQSKIDTTNHNLLTETEVKKNMDDYIHQYETEHPIAAELIGKTITYTKVEHPDTYLKITYNKDNTVSTIFHDTNYDDIGSASYLVDTNKPNIITYTDTKGNINIVTYTRIVEGATMEDKFIPASGSKDTASISTFKITNITLNV